MRDILTLLTNIIFFSCLNKLNVGPEEINGGMKYILHEFLVLLEWSHKD